MCLSIEYSLSIPPLSVCPSNRYDSAATILTYYLSNVRRTFDFELPPYVCLSNIRLRIRRRVSVRQTSLTIPQCVTKWREDTSPSPSSQDDGPVTITITHNITQCHAAGYRDGNTIALTSLISNTVASVSPTVAAYLESVESLVIHHVHLDSAAVLLINEIEYLTKRGSLRHSTVPPSRNYAFLSILYTPSNPHHHRVATFRIGFAVRVRRHCNNFRRRCFPCSTDPARRQCFDRDQEKK